MRNEKVLLLGGTGTLSYEVLRYALSKEYSVTIMNRGSSKKTLDEKVRTLICDFKDEGKLKSLFYSLSFDIIVDFLSRTPEDIDRVYNVLKTKCKQYIFISSACVYRRAKEDFPLTEESPKPNNKWSYNTNKYEAEQKLIKLNKDVKSTYTIVRPYITYNDERIPLGITPAYKYHRTIIERIKAGKPWFIWNGGQCKCTLTYAEEFATGVVGLFLNEKAINTDFHITSDFVYTQMEVIKILYEKIGMPLNVIDFSEEEIVKSLPEYNEMLIGDRAIDAIFDNSKIKDAVPQLVFRESFEKNIEKILSYWDSRSSYDYDYKFDAQIDKLICKKTRVLFVKYPNSSKNARKTYLLFRYLPKRFAELVFKHLL